MGAGVRGRNTRVRDSSARPHEGTDAIVRAARDCVVERRGGIHTTYKSIVLVEVPDPNLIAGLASFFTGDPTLRRLWTRTWRRRQCGRRHTRCASSHANRVLGPLPTVSLCLSLTHSCAWLFSTSRSCTCCGPWHGSRHRRRAYSGQMSKVASKSAAPDRSSAGGARPSRAYRLRVLG